MMMINRDEMKIIGNDDNDDDDNDGSHGGDERDQTRALYLSVKVERGDVQVTRCLRSEAFAAWAECTPEVIESKSKQSEFACLHACMS